jgi:hypothetical protein
LETDFKLNVHESSISSLKTLKVPKSEVENFGLVIRLVLIKILHVILGDEIYINSLFPLNIQLAPPPARRLALACGVALSANYAIPLATTCMSIVSWTTLSYSIQSTWTKKPSSSTRMPKT